MVEELLKLPLDELVEMFDQNVRDAERDFISLNTKDLDSNDENS